MSLSPYPSYPSYPSYLSYPSIPPDCGIILPGWPLLSATIPGPILR